MDQKLNRELDMLTMLRKKESELEALIAEVRNEGSFEKRREEIAMRLTSISLAYKMMAFRINNMI